MTIQFTVYGTPVPQGSTRAFIPKGWNRPVITSANKKTKPWRQEIAGAALETLQGCTPAGRNVPIAVNVNFYFHKPSSAKKSVSHKTTKPDLDKLARSVLDALTGVLFEDDSQVVSLYVTKGFSTPERAEITISEVSSLASVPSTRPIREEEIAF